MPAVPVHDTVRVVTAGREPSIFAEMALRFVEDREVLATSALGHILSSSVTAGTALRDLFGERARRPRRPSYRTEAVTPDETGRPDIVGAIGTERHLIIEGKFWATLTDNQPVEYLHKLVDGGCLVFVVPQPRLETVGAEILRRSRDAELVVTPSESAGGFHVVGPRRWRLGVLAWRTLLLHIGTALSDAGEGRLAADVEQLASLTELVDSDAFLPLVSADLSNPTPLRVYQYMELVNAVVDHGVARGRFDVTGFRSTATMGQYLRYARAGPIQIAVAMDLISWAKRRHTPLWLEVAVEPGDAFRVLEAEHPPRVLFAGYKGRPYVPLTLPLHVEHQDVVHAVYDQIEEVLDLGEGRSAWDHCKLGDRAQR